MKRKYICAYCGRRNTFDSKKGKKRCALQESRGQRRTPIIAFLPTCRFCKSENVIPASNSMPRKLHPRSDFWTSKSVDQLAAEQGVKPVDHPEKLRGDFWPEGESMDDFLIWLRDVREAKGEK